jgi:iron(III) transport system ATP-binding protein
VAGFVGEANLVGGHVSAGVAHTILGPLPLAAPADGEARVLVRPEHLRVDDARTQPGSGTVAADVDLVEFYGHDTVYVVRLADGFRLRARESSAPEFARGDLVSVRYAGAPPLAYRDGQPVAAPT